LRPAESGEAGPGGRDRAHLAELVPAAKVWIKANPGAHTQPWDQKGFKYPGGGAVAPNIRQIATLAPMMLVNKTRGLYARPRERSWTSRSFDADGLDAALRAESRGLTSLMATKEAKGGHHHLLLRHASIKAGKVRPAGERWRARTSAVLGAGDDGLRHCLGACGKGLPTVLKDTALENAEKGKSYSVATGGQGHQARQHDAGSEGRPARPDHAATTDETYRDCDLINRAVFEDIELKEQVIPASFKMLKSDGIYGSNTSTAADLDPGRELPGPHAVIGLHFFSPVDKMKIVEIILGKKTSEQTLRKAYDYVQQIGYMPIVVNDSRGFFTSRVFGTFMDEGLQLLQGRHEPGGHRARGLEGGHAGGPAGGARRGVDGAVAQGLSHAQEARRTPGREEQRHRRAQHRHAGDQHGDVRAQTRRSPLWRPASYEYALTRQEAVERLVSVHAARCAGVDGRCSRTGCSTARPSKRLRCLDEGVPALRDRSQLGFNLRDRLPSPHRGALQFTRGIGIARFAARAAELAQRYGERFVIKEERVGKAASIDIVGGLNVINGLLPP